jgi:hypothetical protein
MNRIYHVTLTTGHGRWSPRSEVANDVLDDLAPMVARAERGTPVALPVGSVPIWLRRVDTVSKHVAVWSLDDADQKSLVTVALALKSRPGAGLWRQLHASLGHVAPGFQTSVDGLPPDPWLAAAIHLPFLLRPDAQELGLMLGDLERCIAWTWIERVRT